MIKLLYDGDAPADALAGKTIAVIGYGAQGRAQARMMHENGLNVVVGVRKNGKSWEQALSDGLNAIPIKEAAKKSDIIHILIPDEVQGEVYRKEIRRFLKPGKTLSFSHGFNIVFGKIKPPEGVDVIMVAPKSPGTEEYKRFREGFGVPALIAVRINATGKARDTALAMAKAMGFTRAGVLECSFEDETYEDLFGEQAVLCGGLTELIKMGFEVLIEDGFPPELAYFECLHEMKLIVDLVYEGGLNHMWNVVSNTAEYGGRTRGPKLLDARVKKKMQKILKKVKNGSFAREWMREYKKGIPTMASLREKEGQHPIEAVGKEIRALFDKK